MTEVCYVWQSESGTYDPNAREWLAACDFADLQIAELTNRLPHFAVTLCPDGSGGFYLAASRLIGDQ